MTAAVPHPWSLTQLHLLMTGECNFECDHCFVWGGPSQSNTMSKETIEHILDQAEELGTIEWIYFEGGEPFLYAELLLWGVQHANERGFKTGIVTNAHWATTDAEAVEQLQPFSGLVEDLSISDDAYHGRKEGPRETTNARRAAKQLGIPVDFITIAGPLLPDSQDTCGQLPAGESTVVYRGRAAEKLAPLVQQKPWNQFTGCLWEDLRQPKRLHVDSLGNMHICQGISIGNMIERPLKEIMSDYAPDKHPIIGPLLAGGPVELVKKYGLAHEDGYADACHLCYLSRSKLMDKFPGLLAPGEMYGVIDQVD